VLSVSEKPGQALVLLVYQDDGLRLLARRARASMAASGRLLPGGRRPVLDRLPPRSG